MQVQINCPHFRTSVYINNGVQQQVYLCADQGCPIDPKEFCVGSKCRFVDIEPKEPKPEEIKEETKEEVSV